MKKLVSIFVFLTLSLPLLADESWIYIASSAESIWYGQPGSFEEVNTKAGVPIAAILGKIQNTKTSHIDLYKWYVSLSDCERNLGKLVTLDIDGNYRFDNDYVKGSGNVASQIAEFIWR